MRVDDDGAVDGNPVWLLEDELRRWGAADVADRWLEHTTTNSMRATVPLLAGEYHDVACALAAVGQRAAAERLGALVGPDQDVGPLPDVLPELTPGDADALPVGSYRAQVAQAEAVPNARGGCAFNVRLDVTHDGETCYLNGAVYPARRPILPAGDYTASALARVVVEDPGDGLRQRVELRIAHGGKVHKGNGVLVVDGEAVPDGR